MEEYAFKSCYTSEKLKNKGNTRMTLVSEAGNEEVTSNYLERILHLQGDKINNLVRRLESEGTRSRSEVRALKHEVEMLREELASARNDIELERRHYAQAQVWMEHFMARLGPTLEVANHQLNIYESGWRALRSPSHRFITFLVKASGLRALKKMCVSGRTFLSVVRRVE